MPTPIDALLIALVLTNVWAFGLFWLDKRRARDGGWRVSEKTLLGMALVGGLGAWFGQHILRHKTRKEPFRTELGLAVVAHLVGVAVLVVMILRYAHSG